MPVNRICVVTFHGEVEPRGPRHALAARLAFPDAKVEFIHHRPAPRQPAHTDVPMLRGSGVGITALQFPTRSANPAALLARKARARIARGAYRIFGIVDEAIYGVRCQGLTRALLASPADVYFAHNIEALLPAASAARKHRAALMFDCMEYYSDMGPDGHPPQVSSATRTLEARWLPQCRLVVASSDAMADALARDYGIKRPLPSYNAAPAQAILPAKLGGGLNLYWRNFMLGLGHRGLDDALQALQRLPGHIRLFVQGRLPEDGGQALQQRIRHLGLGDRVTILPPYPPENAVASAAPYDVGLCLEHRGNRNHDLTVSNKMFDYLMGGLAVVSSDLAGLAHVIERSHGGLTFEPGNVDALVAVIDRLDRDRQRLGHFQECARRFAMDEGNREREIERVARAMREALR